MLQISLSWYICLEVSCYLLLSLHIWFFVSGGCIHYRLIKVWKDWGSCIIHRIFLIWVLVIKSCSVISLGFWVVRLISILFLINVSNLLLIKAFSQIECSALFWLLLDYTNRTLIFIFSIKLLLVNIWFSRSRFIIHLTLKYLKLLLLFGFSGTFKFFIVFRLLLLF